MREKFSPREIALGLVVALVARASTAALLLSLRPANTVGPWQEGWATVAPDTFSYLEPAERLLSEGTFAPDWRLPGYALPYLLLRLFFEAGDAASALCVLQVICSALALVGLAAVTLELQGSRRLSVAVFITFAASSFTAMYDTYLGTESLAISALVFVVWALLRLRRSGSLQLAVAAGVVGAWAVFLRPVLGAAIVGMGFWLSVSGLTLRKWRLGLAFLVPLVLGLGAWGVRTLSLHDRFEPLGARWAPYYRPADRALHNFVQAFGGSIVHWNPKADIVWFEFMIVKEFRIPDEAVAAIQFPSDMYTSRVTPGSLSDIKSRLRRSLRPEIDEATRTAEQAAVARELQLMTNSIRDERPFFYYVKAPLRVLWSHLVHPGTVGLLPVPWRELSGALLFFKLAMSAIYVWVVTFGLLGLVLLCLGPNRGDWGWALLAGAFLIPLLAHTILLRLDEYRYFAPSFPFALVFACRASDTVLRWRRDAPRA